MKGVEINMNESEHKEDSSKEKSDKEKAKFGKTNEKYISNEAKKENWEQFRVELDRILKNKKALELCEKQIMHKNEQDHLDEIWSIIERATIEAANKSLPKKKMRFIRDRLGLPIEETDKLEFNLTIKKINTDLQLEIQQAEDI
ncbi:35643_t:CDS:2 [Gigaspora margarita]|uniref:35643_t:CDS:1 n=1 Tax=Gigaspora margarita TaxID=4874 RepID=A0ABN7W6D0_GIGMA|nr:35643_t:CDS:2 [Gigaspora margarita]